jgi:hypothetical protein
MTYRQLLEFLKGLEQDRDDRLDDTVQVYMVSDGEYYPADMFEIELTGDDVLNECHLFIAAYDWSDDFQENDADVLND